MALFHLDTKDGRISLVVRARCSAMVREVAVQNAGQEGTRVWRDPALSTLKLSRELKDSTGPARIMNRTQHDE